jgi:hypothetical protein
MRKLLSTITLVSLSLLGVQVIPATAADCVSGGSGTAEAPIVICDGTDFAALKSATSGHYVLGSDIFLGGGITWNSNSDFDGTLDGAGHTVYGLEFVSNASTAVNGLFDNLGPASVIKNLRITESTLVVESRSYAGFLAYSIEGLVENVVIEGTIYTDSTYTAGFAGQLNGGTITNSISAVYIQHSTSGYVSGFVGINDGSPIHNVGTISNSMFIGGFENGWQNPISLESMPWWDHQTQPDPPMPTCETVLQTYYLSTSTSAPRGCGASKTETELANANSSTPGFTSWSSDKWVFGQGAGLPQLKTFAVAPRQLLLPHASAGAASIHLTWLPPLGEYITDFQVQTRTKTSYWADAQKTLVEDGATVTGLANGTAYWTRVRTVNPNGWSDWNYVSSPVTPIDVASVIANPVASSKKGVLTVTWVVPTTNNGASITKYQVGLFKSSTSLIPYKVVSTTALKATIKNLRVKTKIWVAVRSQNAAGFSFYSAKRLITIK